MENEQRKQSFLYSPALKRIGFVLSGLIFVYIVFYYSFLNPREVKIPPDDRERLQYYLTLADQSKQGSETYNRQIQNILKISVGYRHVLNFLERGKKNYEKGLYTKALEDYEKVKKMLPDWDGIYIRTGECHRALHQTDHAKTELKEAIDLNPETPKAYLLLGEMQEDENLLDDAILQYTKALFVSPKNGQIFLKLSGVYIKKKRYEKAREFRDKARELGIQTNLIDAMLEKAAQYKEEAASRTSMTR
jgi:tetratricopeptide (TPR) repeat protein